MFVCLCWRAISETFERRLYLSRAQQHHIPRFLWRLCFEAMIAHKVAKQISREVDRQHMMQIVLVTNPLTHAQMTAVVVSRHRLLSWPAQSSYLCLLRKRKADCRSVMAPNMMYELSFYNMNSMGQSVPAPFASNLMSPLYAGFATPTQSLRKPFDSPICFQPHHWLFADLHVHG